jgi:hypothetical protein
MNRKWKQESIVARMKIFGMHPCNDVDYELLEELLVGTDLILSLDKIKGYGERPSTSKG